MNALYIKIGDWVSYDGIPVKIKEMTSISALIDMSICKDYTSDEVWTIFDNLFPIPLTEEILKKNEWKLKEGEYSKDFGCLVLYLNKGYFHRNLRSWVIGTSEDYLRTIHYVHELQHLLWALEENDNLKV